MPESRYKAVLDACVLVNLPVCDALLRSAEQKVYRPIWSEKILEEVKRALVESLGIRDDKAQHRIDTMKIAFPWATTSDALEIQYGLPDIDDEHVLATAVAAKAQAIVTFNLRHFPSELCSPYEIEPVHPDVFLVRQFDRDPNGMWEVIAAQRRTLSNPPHSVQSILKTLDPWLPEFVNRIRTHIAADNI